MSPLAPLTMSPKSTPGRSPTPATVVAAPSWTSRMTISTPGGLHLLGHTVGGDPPAPRSRARRYRRRDELVQVVGDRADETDVDIARSADPRSGSAAEPSSWRTLAPRYSHAAPPSGLVTGSYGAITRFTRSSYPWSNSWLPTADTSSPASLSASMVGLSLRDERLERATPRSGRRPRRTPCSGTASRSCSTAPASTAAPASMPTRLDAAVEVVDAEDLDRPGGRGDRPDRPSDHGVVVGRAVRVRVVEERCRGSCTGCTRARWTRRR